MLGTDGRVRRYLTCAAFGLVVAACGGSSEEPTTEQPASTVVTNDDTEPAGGAATTLVTDGDVAFAAAGPLASRAVDDFGSDGAAVEAVLSSVELGYGYDQIRDGITSGTIRLDGTIEDEEPVNPSLGLVVLAFRAPREPVPIEQLRDEAIRNGTDEDGFREEGPLVGREGTQLVLTLLGMGYSGEELVDALVFGFELEVLGDEQIRALEPACAAIHDGTELPGGDDACEEFEIDCGDVIVVAGDVVPQPGCPDPDAPGGSGEPEPSEDESATPDDDGQLNWTGPLVGNFTGSWSQDPSIEAFITLTRTPDTDTFEVFATGTRISMPSCGPLTKKSTFRGTGTFVTDSRIDLQGTNEVDWESACTETEDAVIEQTLTVQLGEGSLSGGFEGFTFEIEGEVPTPIDS